MAWQEGDEEGLIGLGYHALDSQGITPAPGNVAIIAGSRSRGKTMWALNIAAKMAAKGRPVLMASLEMTAMEIYGRIVAMRTRIPAWRVKRKGELSAPELDKILSAMKAIKEMPFYVDDSARTISDIEAAALKSYAIHGTRTVFVDYLQIIRLPKSDQASQRATLLGDAVADLKQLAKKINGVVFVLSQVNAEGECKESRAIEEVADQIYLLDREFDSPNLKLTVTKSRNSGVAECNLTVHLESGVVSDVE
jgi:replicative DNA helicase